MLVKTFASAVHGVNACTITVEVNAGGIVPPGNNCYHLVGLPDSVVREGFQRIEAGLKNVGFKLPRLKIVVNLAAADLPEFKRSVLEVLRQPLEERKVTISRAKISVDYPASFMLIASMNPWRCPDLRHPNLEGF